MNKDTKVYKTPIYTRNAVKNYVNRQKELDPEGFKQRKAEADKRYYEKKKLLNAEANVDANKILIYTYK